MGGKFLIAVGVVCLIAGLLLEGGHRFTWMGKLPGDIAIKRDGFSFYAPLGTCLVLSIGFSALIWLISKFR